MKLRNAALLIFIILVIDQFSKVYVKTNFLYEEEVEVFSWFRIHFIENEGMAWGTTLPGDNGKLFLTLFRILAIFGIGYWLYDSVHKEKSNYLIVAVSLIFAGALGNIIDSVLYGVMFNDSHHQLATFFPPDHYATWFHGRVVDMFYFPIYKFENVPDWFPFRNYDGSFTFFNAIFNVADFAISVGVGILIVFNKRAFTLPERSRSRIFSDKLD